ncbi:MAG: hypothetical protein LBT87_07740 [Treponema sp.]|jgi:hypothetical protein|nr:hypothetical protein [Treponema sp.]
MAGNSKKTFAAFVAARERYREELGALERKVPGLGKLQQELVDRRSGPAYPVETPVVYNRALDDVGPADRIRLILVADNPGRREQAAENRRYLVGPSGKIAEAFFRNNPELGIDFHRNVVILNKTPVHTPRTADLAELCRLDPEIAGLVEASQRIMAALLLEFHRALAPAPVWISGCSQMRRGGIFAAYTESLARIYSEKANAALRESLFLYRHFSMNQFTIHLRQETRPGEKTEETLLRIGRAYRERILGKYVF